MAKLGSKIRKTVTELLKPGEQLQEVEQLFYSQHGFLKSAYLDWNWLNPEKVGDYKDWYAGVTNLRFILIPLNKFSKPQVDQTLSLPLSDLEVTPHEVIVQHGPVAGKFKFHGGAKFATGLDRMGFLSAIHQQQQLQR